jgi:dihydroorotate dehydrogenase
MSHQFDALIATNTTVARPDSLTSKHAQEAGGLSGAPVKDLSTRCIREFYRLFNGKVQIIGVGGIKTADDAWEKMLAGADYLQIYTQFIYQGPAIIRQIVEGLESKVQAGGFADLAQAMDALRS